MAAKKVLYLLFIIGLFGITAFAQTENIASETSGNIPELEQFHEVIYPIWHQAYPEKDIKALKGYVSEITNLVEKLYVAKLPKFLHEKTEKWNKGIADFKSTVNNYVQAAQGSDDAALLKAAEDLHSGYEKLVRIIRPVAKEVDEFHKSLYVVYHYYLPGKQYSKILEASNDMLTKAHALTTAKLSKRHEPKMKEFEAAAKELIAAVQELNAIKSDKDAKLIEDAVEKMHTKYVNVERIFDK